jgi:hypothetical protein
MIPQALGSFLESGLSVLIGSRNEKMIPSCARAVGAICSADRTTLTVLLAEAPARDVLRDLERSRRAAVTFCRPIDERTMQLKGTVTAVRPASEAEVECAREYRRAFAKQLEIVGLPRCITERITIAPCVAVDIRVEDLFRQTPGPNAGARLTPESEQ